MHPFGQGFLPHIPLCKEQMQDYMKEAAATGIKQSIHSCQATNKQFLGGRLQAAALSLSNAYEGLSQLMLFIFYLSEQSVAHEP